MKGGGEDARSVATLADLCAGERAKISRLHTQNRQTLKRVIAMGLLPKTELTLLRRSPTYVFSVGNARFAIDVELARLIYVKKL